MFYIFTLICSQQGANVLVWFFDCDGVFWFGRYVNQFFIYSFTFIYLHISVYLLLMYVFVYQSIYLLLIYLFTFICYLFIYFLLLHLL